MKYFVKKSFLSNPVKNFVPRLKKTLTLAGAGATVTGTGLYMASKKPKREWDQGILQ